ncbi:hypothetical protein BC936DRAFT_140265 [Jimgerdemannia flammicorona]|uniref:HIT-type domain-containing protein n=1 Tax=Jimgerdemannia flammicorona TaxID=994334 RepID=A0A433AVP4_9FUNG|nr:hypothetical protein BC936DRAFT_140265 [Jimgerdemannia flammicorona]
MSTVNLRILHNLPDNPGDHQEDPRLCDMYVPRLQTTFDLTRLPKPKQFSKYTCPRCNLKYCSLTCYKDEAHVVCTESFYKDSIVEEIKSRQVDENEKRRMLEMLQKFEKESAEQSEKLEESDEEDDEQDFAQRFVNMDIDASSFDDIWSKLTPQEQAEFQRKVLKGEAPSNIAPEEEDELSELVPVWRPWWELEAEGEGSQRVIIELDDNGGESEGRQGRGEVVRPAIVADVKALEKMTKQTPNPCVVFNLINVLFSYALTCRRTNGDPFDDPNEACTVLEHISALILFSREPFVYGSVAEAVADCIQRVMERPYSPNPSALSLTLLQDLVHLFVTPSTTLSALSDLVRLLRAASSSTSVPTATRRKVFHAEKKACFCVAYVRHLGDQGDAVGVLRSAVKSELERRGVEAREYEAEKEKVEEALRGRKRPGRLVEEVG